MIRGAEVVSTAVSTVVLSAAAMLAVSLSRADSAEPTSFSVTVVTTVVIIVPSEDIGPTDIVSAELADSKMSGSESRLDVNS
jgi:hypothetical protein